MTLQHGLTSILALPAAHQLAAIDRLRRELDTPHHEAWNTAFGPSSLFDAWTRTRLVDGIYAAIARTLAPVVAEPGWVVVDVGGGDGRLWSRIDPQVPGTVVLVDPAEDPHRLVRHRLPDHVQLVSLQTTVQLADLPDCDAIVCSLTLHHVPGHSAAHRAAHDLPGPGKLEVLQGFGRALKPGGKLLLHEADVYCDLDLPSGDPTLRDRLVDSYVRRCARALLAELPTHPAPDRLAAIIHHWCLDQVDAADASLADRDVYELDVPRWLALLDAAGFDVLEHGFTDDVHLFHRYLATPC